MKTASVLALLLVLGCTAQPAATSENSINEEETRRVLQHHWDTFQANDLEGTMADYTEESTLITPDRTFHGLEEIRNNFIGAFAAFPKDSSSLKLKKTVVSQDIGYIIWEASAPKFNLTFGTDTFIIQNGKIVRQTYAGVAAPK